ncbi:MAG: energy transducer TonB [bacterium]
MAKMKSPDDLRGRYREIFEKSLALSLGLFLLVFLCWQTVEIKAYESMRKQEIIQVEDIPETKQLKKPPPPVRPAVPIETESEDLPEDVTIETTELDAVIDLVPPPPPDEAPPPDEFWWAEEMPQLTHYSVPEYPEIARKVGLECVVIVYILVDEEGNAAKVKIAKPCGNVGFNEAAEEAAWKCRFTPGRQNEKPIRVWVSIPFRFKMEGKR